MDVAEHNEFGTASGGGDCENKTVKKLLFKNSNGAKDYLTLKTRLAFTKLKKAFTKTLILQHFDLECYIRIETDILSYAISEVLNQLTLNNLGQ